MIIWGTKTALRRTESTVGPCSNCGHINCVEIYIFQNYFHLFWIPTIPLDKTGWSKCEDCEEVLIPSQMHGSLLSIYKQVIESTKPPIWAFSGIAVIVTCIIWAIFANAQRRDDVIKRVLSPKEGDFFEMKLSDTRYTLFKVKTVGHDSVYFFPNKYEASDEKGVDKLGRADISFDSTAVYGIPMQELIKMAKEDKILKIDH